MAGGRSRAAVAYLTRSHAGVGAVLLFGRRAPTALSLRVRFAARRFEPDGPVDLAVQ